MKATDIIQNLTRVDRSKQEISVNSRTVILNKFSQLKLFENANTAVEYIHLQSSEGLLSFDFSLPLSFGILLGCEDSYFEFLLKHFSSPSKPNRKVPFTKKDCSLHLVFVRTSEEDNNISLEISHFTKSPPSLLKLKQSSSSNQAVTLKVYELQQILMLNVYMGGLFLLYLIYLVHRKKQKMVLGKELRRIVKNNEKAFMQNELLFHDFNSQEYTELNSMETLSPQDIRDIETDLLNTNRKDNYLDLQQEKRRRR